MDGGTDTSTEKPNGRPPADTQSVEHEQRDAQPSSMNGSNASSLTITQAVMTSYINDQEFCRNVRRLTKLKFFLLQEGTTINTVSSSTSSHIHRLRYQKKDSRDPTPDEWAQLDSRTEELFNALTPALRRKFMLGEIPAWVSWGPLILVLLAVGSLGLAAYFFGSSSATHRAETIFVFYMTWLVSLGAIGSIAFLGMNALLIQSDATFDLTNRRLMIQRIVLGALFGLVFTLPLGVDGFTIFLAQIKNIAVYPKPEDAPQIDGQVIALLIAPFVLGFSTSLVITIMNRMVDAVQAFFGRTSPVTSEPGSRGNTTPTDSGAAKPGADSKTTR